MRKCSCPCDPISPLLCCPVGTGAAPPDGEADVGALGEDDVVDQKHALFNDLLIWHVDALYDSMGPGALEATSVQTPKGMTAAQWAKHRLTHLPYHPGRPCCAASRRPNTQHRRSHESDRVVPLLVGD